MYSGCLSVWKPFLVRWGINSHSALDRIRSVLEQSLTPLALCAEQTWDENPKGGDELHRNAIGRQQAGDKKMEAMVIYQNETFKPGLHCSLTAPVHPAQRLSLAN